MCCFYEAKTLRIDKTKFPKEPEVYPDVETLRTTFAGKSCPVCQGHGWLRCSACEDGEVSFLGGKQACRRCHSSGVVGCMVCDRTGKLSAKQTGVAVRPQHEVSREPVPSEVAN